MRHVRFKAVRKHVLFLAVAAAYLLSANQLYARIFIHHGRPETANISLPSAGQAAILKVSDMRLTREDGQDVYELRGFAFLSRNPGLEHQIRVVLQAQDGTNLIFATQPATAPAMVRSSGYRDLGVEHSEFRALISKYAVPEGSYQIGILLEPASGAGTAATYTLTGATVRRTPNFLRYTRPPE